MYKVKRLFKTLLTPVTIMIVPHSGRKPLSVRVPSVGIVFSLVVWAVGTTAVFFAAVDTVKYQAMEDKVAEYTEGIAELESTMATLRSAEIEFKRLLTLGSKQRVLENVDSSAHTLDAGSLNMDAIKGQVNKSIETVESVRAFLREQRDLYVSTPEGWPVEGSVSSPFGVRDNPVHGRRELHSGIDISCERGLPVRATADGVVSFSGWSRGGGNLVVVEHGLGYQTVYAHNRLNTVKVGERVKRGDVLAFVGATGNATGPHLHYEVWKGGKAVDPMKYVEAEHVL